MKSNFYKVNALVIFKKGAFQKGIQPKMHQEKKKKKEHQNGLPKTFLQVAILMKIWEDFVQKLANWYSNLYRDAQVQK